MWWAPGESVTSSSCARARPSTRTVAYGGATSNDTCASVASSSIQSAAPDVSDVTVRVQSRLGLRGFAPLMQTDTLYSPGGVTPRLLQSSSGMRHLPELLFNPFGPTRVERLDLAVGPMASEEPLADGDPDGFLGLSRRGPYERLLLTEWLLSTEAPDESDDPDGPDDPDDTSA